jgi:hypothetical protein
LAREDLFVDPPTGTTAQQRTATATASAAHTYHGHWGREHSLQITDANRDRYAGVLEPAVIANLDDKLPKVQMSGTDTGDREALVARLTAPAFEAKWVNLSPYIDMSSVSVPETFSLERAYALFRTMGLRHLVVTDKRNGPVGVVSRKDLLPLRVEERLQEQEQERERGGGRPAAVDREASSAEVLDQSEGSRQPINAGNRSSSSGKKPPGRA